MDQNSEGTSSSQNNWLIPGSIIVAGAVIALAVVYSGSSLPKLSNRGDAPRQVLGSVEKENLADGGASLGDPAAPVTIVEFSDFQCPFCGKFFKTVEPLLKEEYIKTGKVRFVYRDFAFLDGFPGVPEGQLESHWAAMAARCAGDQGKFWEYHDYLFNHQAGENQGAFAKANLKKFASALGLNPSQFNACLDNDKYKAAVEKDVSDGRLAGVNGTPGTFVDGELISGAVPYEEFKVAIDQALASHSAK